MEEYEKRIGCEEEEVARLLKKLTPACPATMTEEQIKAAHSRWIGNGSIAKCQGTVTPERIDDILRRKFMAG